MNLIGLVATALKSVPTGVKGQITIKDKLGPSRDALSGAASTGPAMRTPYTATCVVVPPKTVYVDGVARVPIYDREVTLAAEECVFPPEVGMTALLGTEEYRILKSTPLDPTGVQVVLYTLGLSK